MLKLTTSTDAQTVKVIPRAYATNISMGFRDVSTSTSVTYTSSASTDKNHLVINESLSVTKGMVYEFKIKESTDVIFKEKWFWTGQTIDQHTNNYYEVKDGEDTLG